MATVTDPRRQQAWLDYESLARQLIKEGGFTTALDGSQPIAGYAVADGSNGADYGIVPTTTLGDIGDMIYRFVIDNGWELRNGRHLGAWLHDGWVYLAATDIYADEAYAMSIAQERGEQAIFNLTNHRDIPVPTTHKRAA